MFFNKENINSAIEFTKRIFKSEPVQATAGYVKKGLIDLVKHQAVRAVVGGYVFGYAVGILFMPNWTVVPSPETCGLFGVLLAVHGLITK